MAIRIGYSAEQTWTLSPDPNDPCEQIKIYDGVTNHPPFEPSVNRIWVEGVSVLGGMQFRSGYSVQIKDSAFGLLDVFRRVPDGVEVLEAAAEIRTEGLTRSRHWGHNQLLDCDNNVIDPGSNNNSSVVEDVQYAVLGLLGPTGYVVLGYLPGAADGNHVVDFTDIARAQLALRKTVFDFAVVVVPGTFSGDILFPPEGAIRSRTLCPGDPCAGKSRQEYYTFETTSIEWSNCSFGQVWVKLDYHGTDKIIPMQPRFPAMVDL